MSQWRFPYFYRIFVGTFVMVLSLVVMWGWIQHDASFIKLVPSFAPMQFNTAFGLFFCGLALLALNFRAGIAGILGGIPIIIGGLTLLEYLLKSNLGIDTFFVMPFTDINVSSVGRQAPNTAAGLLLSGVSLLLCAITTSLTSKEMLLVAGTSSVVAALGAIPLVGCIAGIDTAYAWGSFNHVALHTASCFLLIGSCIIMEAFLKDKHILIWLPLPVFLTFVVIAVSLATAVRSHENEKFEAELQVEADNIGNKASVQLSDLYKALDRLMLRWEVSGGTPENLWESDAAAYLEGYPFMAALSWADTDQRIRWIVPKPTDTKAIGFKLDTEPLRAEAIRRAIDTRTPQATKVLTLLSGEKGFLYINPLFQGDVYDGLQIGAFRLGPLFDGILDHAELHEVYLNITEDGETIFTNLPDGTKLSDRWQKSASIRNNRSEWILHVSPTPAFLDVKNSLLSLAVLVVGIFASLLISLCTYLATHSYFQNQTLRKIGKARQKLLADIGEAEALKQVILDSSGYMIVASDKNGNVHTFNRVAEQLLGYSAAEIIGKLRAGHWHDPGDLRRRAEELSVLLNKPVKAELTVFVEIPLLEGSETREWTFVRKDGSRFPVLLTVSVLRDSNQQVTGYLGIAKDISKEKEDARKRRVAEEKLRTSEERLHLAASGTSDGLWDWNILTDEIYYSPRVLSDLGFGEDELTRTIDGFKALLHPDDIDTTFKAVVANQNRKASYDVEYRLRHKDGRYVWFNSRGQTAWNDEGVPVRMTGFLTNIDARKMSDVVRQDLIKKLTESNTELERFAYVASHDMQEPLRMVTNFSGLIEKEFSDKLNDEGREYLHLVTESSARMRSMIEDLLEYARIGNDSIRFVTIDPSVEVKHVVDNLSATIHEHGATITWDKLPLVKGNPVQFMRLLQNLVSNGLKYQPPGAKPIIHVGVVDHGEKWCFTVADNGIGMAEEYVNLIFEPFKRLHSWSEYKGSGIGLAVCRKIVENHEGIIWVTSSLGKGSVFYFTVPKMKPEFV